MKVSRRGVLAGAAAGGGLLVAFLLLPQRFDAPLEPAEGEAGFNAWLKIAGDGVVTVAVPQCEMGQGVTTLIPQIVAMELGADWRQIAVEPAPPAGAYPNVPLASLWAPLWLAGGADLASDEDSLLARRFAERTRFNATAAGTTLAAYEAPARAAAATARAMLIAEAAARWGIAPEECRAQDGFIVAGERQLRFADLAEAAAQRDPPDVAPLRSEPPAEPPTGPGARAETDFPRLDLPAKVDGSFLFAGDIRLPGMAYVAIRHGPIDRPRLKRYEREAAAKVRGLVGVVQGNRWLAAAGETWWAAERALAAMKPVFGITDPVSSEGVARAIDRALADGEAHEVALVGAREVVDGRATLSRRYDIAPAVHAPIETASVTAWLDDGKLTMWIASQVPERVRVSVARAVGIEVEDVILVPMAAGGSFDARLDHAHAIEAAVIARELGRPVQLVWSRWQEMIASPPRAPAAAQLSARLGRDGAIIALKSRIAVPPFMHEQGARLFDNRTTWAAREDNAGRADPLAVAGAVPAYAIANLAVDHVPVDTRLPVARMRGGGDALTAFFTECFVDEVAQSLGREKLSYRIAMLGQDLAMVEVLQRAARLAQWDGGAAAAGQGIACHRMVLGERVGRIACVAQATPGEGGIRVSRLSVAADIGRIVNRDLARQQIEGGLIFGLSLVLGSAIGYDGGLPTSARLGSLGLPTLADSPDIAIDFVTSDQEPFDPGELGTVIAAPAIANALFSATGQRLRSLPLDLAAAQPPVQPPAQPEQPDPPEPASGAPSSEPSPEPSIEEPS
ncbi:xanthine dehydrogenase family protein molybdopterin-binding subunit [Alteriqipengyuania lutimaris]|uniref:Xanthine dehydrogenase family protein molybdopterin-binding subunit n=1 Tax=Alteriqipengyuania lutimaris TaxID=1538146 RepID=A0A395LRL1_9SPHN|nr:molybdopterin cofactor-binding domain-containing protein [Alteriqipengyuania lutimaris]MBB3033758.1 isoquinoline 1-oxidoreductase beta subunit [Alteriqipengyuania lutimaris]RDS77260.1 xanthine dehydrogenase family protein molybdopterin-binding subunit [Alteriqipengyuania lutimaris]